MGWRSRRRSRYPSPRQTRIGLVTELLRVQGREEVDSAVILAWIDIAGGEISEETVLAALRIHAIGGSLNSQVVSAARELRRMERRGL